MYKINPDAVVKKQIRTRPPGNLARKPTGQARDRSTSDIDIGVIDLHETPGTR